MKTIEQEQNAVSPTDSEIKDSQDTPIDASINGLNSNSPTDKKNILEILLRKLQQTEDFPAFSQHILEINQKASASSENPTSPSQLARVIIKDYSLTNKLLKLVNSAFYGSFSGKISTITKAVMVLGFKQVSLAASSIMLFNHLSNKAQSKELKEAAFNSFMSGLIAKDLATRIGAQCLEESFICAMLKNVGRHLVIYYLPGEWQSICERMARNGDSERNMSRIVLGIYYEDIAMSVLKTWNFPSKIIDSLVRLPEGKLEKPTTDTEILRSLSGYANELCDIIRHTRGTARASALKALSTRFQKVVPISEKQLTSILDSAKVQMEEYLDVLGINVHEMDFLRQLAMDTDTEASKESKDIADKKTPDADAAESIQHEHLDVLINGIQEITNALLTDYHLNELMFMILETMYRGFGFNRVIFCMMEISRTRIRARHAFGAEAEKVGEIFSFNITLPPRDLFNIALSQRRDIMVDDAGDPRIAPLIPEWYRKNFSAPAFLIYPIIVKETAFGLFYADKKQKAALLTPTELNYLKTLRNQAILAIKQKI